MARGIGSVDCIEADLKGVEFREVCHFIGRLSFLIKNDMLKKIKHSQ